MRRRRQRVGSSLLNGAVAAVLQTAVLGSLGIVELKLHPPLAMFWALHFVLFSLGYLLVPDS